MHVKLLMPSNFHEQINYVINSDLLMLFRISTCESYGVFSF